MKTKLDVLLIARPDHSLQIYNSLLEQEELSFTYVSFKVFPRWLKMLIRNKRMVTIQRNVKCSWKLTFINLCRYKFHFKFAQNWDETRAFDNILKRIFSTKDVHIIHYWPEYGNEVIQNYVETHEGVYAFADIHMPLPSAVYEYMKPIYLKYDINPESTQLALMAKEQRNFIDRAKDILVPSSYVSDTYKTLYQGKNFYVISYGITVSKIYEKQYRTKIKDFVYAGRISLEKGSDLLLEYFSHHREYVIHLYGNINDGQEFIFNKYKKYSNILFHGTVPKVELPKYLKNCHVGIHLSRFDAYSLAVGEMLGVGLPVIVSSNTGIKDDILNEKLGLVTQLTMNSVEKAIQTITDIDTYNQFIDNIDNYIHTKNISYGKKMLDFYKTLK